jgi:ribulose-phosphate 3-epimerase
VDGGVNADNAGRLIQAGAEVLVAGSYVFGAASIEGAIRSLKNSEY